MKLDEILSAAGRHKRAKRIGRGRGSGTGKTSGRGHKGYGSRAGAKRRAGYEGGQNPLLRRIPQRGFTNIFADPVEIVNLADLERVFTDGDVVDADVLAAKGLIDDPRVAVKLLGNGELKHKLTVSVTRASKAAAEKFAAAGGTLELTGTPLRKKRAAPPKAAKPDGKTPDAPAATAKPDEKTPDAPAATAKPDGKTPDAPAATAKPDEKTPDAPAAAAKPDEKTPDAPAATDEASE